MTPAEEFTNFYEVGREYYWLHHDLKTPTGVMVVIAGDVAFVTDPRTGMTVLAQPTNLKGAHGDQSYTIWATKGVLTPVERPSGEAKIFSEFVK